MGTSARPQERTLGQRKGDPADNRFQSQSDLEEDAQWLLWAVGHAGSDVSQVPVQDKSPLGGNLERFAMRIEERLAKSKGPFALEQLVCRLLTGKNPAIAAKMAEKVVEWRYGKSVQPITGTGEDGAFKVVVEHIAATQVPAQAE